MLFGETSQRSSKPGKSRQRGGQLIMGGPRICIRKEKCKRLVGKRVKKGGARVNLKIAGKQNERAKRQRETSRSKGSGLLTPA